MALKKLDYRSVRRGDVLGNSSDCPPTATSEFVALVAVLDWPWKVWSGDSVTIECHTAKFSCRIACVEKKLDRRNGLPRVETCPQSLISGDVAMVRLVPLNPVCVERFCDFSALGRFAIREPNLGWVAVGLVCSK